MSSLIKDKDSRFAIEKRNGAETADNTKHNATLDIAKLFFALLVVGIHTEPFGFSFLLDNGFGIITRLCVPFFFVASSYFFFLREKQAVKYVQRLFILYLVWCVMYLPMNFSMLKTMTFLELITHYFWDGHDVLWYIWGSIIGFLITYGLSRIAKPRTVLIISFFFLLLGCAKSTYLPLLKNLFGISFLDFLGSRNGLFYGFPYYALGLVIAKREPINSDRRIYNLVGFFISMCLLAVESVIFVVILKTSATILWMTVLPMTYYLFMLLKQITIPLSYKHSIMIRKTSILVYVVHPFFLRIFGNLRYFVYFFVVSLITVVVSLIIVYVSSKRPFRWLRILY